MARRRAVRRRCGADTEECGEEEGAPSGGRPGPSTRFSNRDGGGRPMRRKRRREAYPSDGDISDEEPYGGEEQLPAYSDEDGAGEEDASDSPAPAAPSRCCSSASCLTPSASRTGRSQPQERETHRDDAARRAIGRDV